MLKTYLTYIGEAGRNEKGRRLCNYRCVCGKEKTILYFNVVRLNTKTCGCLRYKMTAEKLTKHGLKSHALYDVWCNIKRRCLDSKFPAYNDYGKRGINICNEWREDFLAFYQWAIESGWQQGLTIERSDNEKGYCPKNCRIATMKEQCNNRRSNKLVSYNGGTKTLAQWCDEKNLSYGTMYARLTRGWKVEQAIDTPIGFNYCGKKIV